MERPDRHDRHPAGTEATRLRSPRPLWLAALGMASLISGCTSGPDAAATTAATVPVTDAPVVITEAATTEPTTTTLPPSTTAAPAPVTTKKPAAAPSAIYSACSSGSLTAINAKRATLGVAALSAGSNTAACAWALHLAKLNGALSHNSIPCGTGGQVVAYVKGSGAGGAASAPASIVNNWFNSPPHNTILMDARYAALGLGYVTRTNTDGSWSVYGVGNACG
jgi:uncharacterized protein YkwD